MSNASRPAFEGRIELAEWKENRPKTSSLRSLPAQLFTERELAWQLAWRSVRARTKQSFLGLFWPITQPITGALLYFLVFNQLAGIESGDVPYPLFAFVGATVWAYTSSSIAAGTSSISFNAGVVTKTYLPRITLPASTCIAALLGLAMSLTVVGIMLVVYRRPPGLALLTLPLWIGLLMLLALGLSSFLSVLNGRSRDVAAVTTYFLQAWQYGSPVGYPAEIVPDRWQTLYHVNPLTGILNGFRWAVLGTELDPRFWLSIGTTLVVLVVGLSVFGRLEKTIADYL